MDALVHDLRAAVRVLASQPGWTIAAILCLAIATGANTAAFTIVNGLLLRPLPFEHPERLAMLAIQERTAGSPRPFTLLEYRQLAETSRSVAMLLARTSFPLSLASTDGARMAQAELVSGNYFETLRIAPLVGHFFDASDDREGATVSVVLSHRLWQFRFAGDPAVVGQSVRVNGRLAVIAGVAPPGFVGAMQLIRADVWLPAALYPDLAGAADAATIPMFGVMGRLADGVTLDQAEARLTAARAALTNVDRGHPAPSIVVRRAAGFGVPVAIRGAVLTMSGLVYVVMALLISVACANVAALILTRGAGRTRETAIRLSLGASRLDIGRQLAVESLVLAIAGCAAGTIAAVWLTEALVARLSTPFQYVSYAIDVHPDTRVLVYSLLTTAAAAVLCGIAPIRSAGRVDVVDALKQSAANGRSRKSMRTLNAMIVAQFAVSTTLLIAAGLLVRTYIAGETAQRRVPTAGLIASTLDLDQLKLDRTMGMQLSRSLMQRLSDLPGVIEVALTREPPVTPGPTRRVVAQKPSALGAPLAANELVVSSRYFRVLGLTIRQGRSLSDTEAPGPRVAVINETMARRFWPDTSPLGLTFTVDQPTSEAIEVVGVVDDAQAGSASQPARAAFYEPFAQEYSPRMTFVLRVQGEPSRLYADIRGVVRELNQDLAIVDLRTVDELAAMHAEQRRSPAVVMALIGLLGLLLSAVGLYGVVGYGVRERAREFAIRLALGARPSDVRRLVFRQGLTTLAGGLGLGLLGAALCAQVVRSRLFGMGAADPLLVIGVSAVLVMAGLAALYIPARWASEVDPAFTLRRD